jgi:hypothetical protein
MLYSQDCRRHNIIIRRTSKITPIVRSYYYALAVSLNQTPLGYWSHRRLDMNGKRSRFAMDAQTNPGCYTNSHFHEPTEGFGGFSVPEARNRAGFMFLYARYNSGGFKRILGSYTHQVCPNLLSPPLSCTGSSRPL